MSENKFIKHLKGESTAKSVLEIKNQSVNTSFANMPQGTSDANRVYADHSGDAVGVLQGAENWKLNGSTLVYASSINSDGNDYTGETDKTGGSVVLDGDGMAVSGAGLWVDATYTFTGDPTKTVAIFNAGTKWVLKLCGHSLFSDNKTIDLTVLIKIGASSVISKVFTVTTDSFNFCKDLVIDFAESTQTVTKVQGNETLKLQVLCSDTSASATIYNGMTVLTSLQRRVDIDTVAGDSYSLDSLETELDNIHSELDGKLNLDGTNTMTGVLKMRASVSFQCAIAPYWDGVGFYKLNDNDSVTLMASMEDTTGFSPFSTNKYDIGTSSKKWKNLYLAGKAYVATINNGGDIAVPTKAGTMALESDIGRTNCITEIPQDIKLELNAGTLTLKAGSKAYVPNGSGVFDTYIAASDIILDNAQVAGTNTWMVAMTSNSGIFVRLLANCVSGAGATTTAGYAYDTTTNNIGWYNAGGVLSGSNCSFPIAIIHTTSGTVDRIDQVFNGAGYIGSTVFVLPNVKGLNPQGLNADGTLNNTTVTISSVMTRTLTAAVTGATLVVDNNNLQTVSLKVFDGTPDVSGATWCYSIKQNKLGVYTPSDQSWSQTSKIIVGTVNATTGGAITSLNQKTAFHAVDYNDTEFIAHQAMPSDKYIDLTLPASGGTVAAPADGYIFLRKGATASGQYVYIGWSNMSIDFVYTAANTKSYVLPCKKGDVITFTYTAAGTTTTFRFIYAQGSK